MNAEIPTVDLADLSSQSPERFDRASRDLKHALGTFGLVYVKGHDVDPAELRALYAGFRSFVNQPLEKKKPYDRPDLWYQRGWTPPNTETAVAAGGQPDFKECYFAAPEEVDAELAKQYPELYPPNVWPTDAANGFKESYLKIGHALHLAGLKLLEGCARSLDLPADTFSRLCEGGPHVTRLLMYLGLRADQVNTGMVWGEEHTDFNLLTLLPGGQFYNPEGGLSARPDDKSGLFLRTRPTEGNPNGTKVRGAAPEGCLVAQVGQQLEILTGGEMIATPHVITAPGAADWTRQSMAHFVHLRSDAVLYPVGPFLNAGTRASYGPPVLAGTYSLKTLVDIGLAPKTALERIGYRHYDRLNTIRAREAT